MAFKQLEIWVEEVSMKHFLKQVLPKLLPDGYAVNKNCFIRTHEGKNHLIKEIPIKAKANCRRANEMAILIILDQDRNDCKELKRKISNIVKENCPNMRYLIRIACKELENWYLGDLAAIENTYSYFNSKKYIKKRKYQNPDILNGAYELEKLVPSFQKVSGAKEISKHIDINSNRSVSFNQFICGLRMLLS